MKGWQLFRHTTTMVLRDMPTTIRVTGLPFAIGAIWPVWFALTAPKVGGVPVNMGLAELGIGYLAMLLLSVLSFLWVAIAWHRYVLLGEVPKVFVPDFSLSRIKSYFARSLLFFVVLVPAAIIGGLVASVGFFVHPILGLILNVVNIGVLLALSGRLCSMLPAAAVGQPIGLKEAWSRTSGATPSIIAASVFLVVALWSIGLLLVALLFLVGNFALFAIPNFFLQWISLILGLSMMTTIYGHYVENRELT